MLVESERRRLRAVCRARPEFATTEQQLEGYVESASIDTVTLTNERLEELYLACACAGGDEAAISAFDQVHSPQIRRVARQFFSGPDAEDFTQLALAHLLVRRNERPARIAAYMGSGPLGAFIRMSVSRLAIDKQRLASPPRTVPLGVLEDVLADHVDAYEVVAGVQMRSQLTKALGEALRKLRPIERRALRMRFVLRFSLARTGLALGIHELSVSRVVARARSRVLAELARSPSLPKSPSLLVALARTLDVSISRLLQTQPENESSDG
ncbi:MAG: sigma-70 family RNA polymerase sigma factor [Nannocystaceae bacterium]|nr:sigma-70 family RNA polymerase sigma factor [Nannocystaceae bacterium]